MEASNRAERRDERLASLDGRRVAGHAIRVEIGSAGPGGARFFELFLEESAGRRGAQPAVRGFYNTGPEPSHNWVEVLRIDLETSFPPNLGAANPPVTAGMGIEQTLFEIMGGLVPPGGHMMVEYETRPDTERALALGVPPAATSLGQLLAKAGCGVSFKDWYFSEGWSEGPRKLQGYKALDSEHARRRGQGMAEELLSFLAGSSSQQQTEVIKESRRRALEVLRDLKTGNEDLDRRIAKALHPETS